MTCRRDVEGAVPYGHNAGRGIGGTGDPPPTGHFRKRNEGRVKTLPYCYTSPHILNCQLSIVNCQL